MEGGRSSPKDVVGPVLAFHGARETAPAPARCRDPVDATNAGVCAPGFAYPAPMTSSKKAARVPAALAKRAEAAAKGKLARLVAEAKGDIALIARRRAEISEAFYDIGEALVRLKRREVVAAMGCRSFAELCERHVGLSSSQAERLVDIVTSMTRAEALSVGATKAASIVALARATPEDDTASELIARGARVRGRCSTSRRPARAPSRRQPRRRGAVRRPRAAA